MLFFSILKGIGIFLLALICLVLVIVLLVLFLPIHYKASGIADDSEFKVRANFGWLFNIIGGRASYLDGEFNAYIRIVFHKIKFFEDDEDYQEDEASEDVTSRAEALEANSIKDNTVAGNSEDAFKKEDAAADRHKEENSDTEKAEDFSAQKEKIDDTRQNLKDKGDFAKAILAKIKFFLSKTKEPGFEHAKLEFVNLLKAICPYKLFLKASYSTGEPDTTGQVLGLISLFPLVYKNRWQISPDFESQKAYLDGKFDIKGNVFLFKILIIGIRLIVDKDCRKLYNEIMN